MSKTAKVGAPRGNTNNSQDNRLWGNTIRRVLTQNPERLRKIAESLVTAAEAGDMAAIKEIGDRLDGRPTQAIEASGEISYNIILQSFLPNSETKWISQSPTNGSQENTNYLPGDT